MTDATAANSNVTLLELRQVPTGKRLAFCLPTGEFLFAVAEDAAARCFCESASNTDTAVDARALYGRNLCQFLAPVDIERLEDFMRGHCAANDATLRSPSGLQIMVHVHPTGAAIWVRLQTIPLSLRLERCIDAAVQSVCRPAHLFADASSFVVSEADFAAMLATVPRHKSLTCSSSINTYKRHAAGDDIDSDAHDDEEEEEIGSIGYSLSSSSDEAPDTKWILSGSRTPKTLETKVPARHRGGRFGKRTSSTASTDIADDDELFFAAADPDDDEDESLAGYAFEADWAAEVVRESFRRSSADWTLRAAPVI